MGLKDAFRMDGQVAVVTGSGRGIGRAIAWGLADYGCDVVINARRIADLLKAVEGIRARGRRSLTVAGDIRDFSDELAEAAVAEFSRLDIWVNNVGGNDEKPTRTLVDTPDEVWRSQLELNLTTAFQGCKAAARMRDGGAIVNISTGAGMRGSPSPVHTPRRRPGWSISPEPCHWIWAHAGSGSMPCPRVRSRRRRIARSWTSPPTTRWPPRSS